MRRKQPTVDFADCILCGVCVRVSWTSNAINATVITATGKHRRKWLTYGEIFSSVFFCQLGFWFCRCFFFSGSFGFGREHLWIMMAGRLRFRCAYVRCVSASRASIYAKCQLVCSSLASAPSATVFSNLPFEREKNTPKYAHRKQNQQNARKKNGNPIKSS